MRYVIGAAVGAGVTMAGIAALFAMVLALKWVAGWVNDPGLFTLGFIVVIGAIFGAVLVPARRKD